MPSETEAVGYYARTACLPCRRSKRRCDKIRPICTLCKRREADCSYPSRRSGQETEIRDVSRSAEGTSADRSLLKKGGATAVYFLAPHVFQLARLEVPSKFEIPIPNQVSMVLGGMDSTRQIANFYFVTIHRWFPIVSKRDFFMGLFSPLVERRVELILLAACMKLSCTSPISGNGAEDETIVDLYRAAKRMHQEAEASGILSIHVLQAGLLLAFFEMSQAVYPAAYLTVGACARYGLALGIDKMSTAAGVDGDAGRAAATWSETEEMRRVWWAVIIFDRFINLSDPCKTLSTADPTFDTYLPVDDTAWDEGTSKSNDAVKVSSGFKLRMGSYARLCQAAYLLSQALRSLQPNDPSLDVTFEDPTAQLRRTLLSLVHAADNEAIIRKLEFCAQSVLCLSVILLLEENRLQTMGNVDDAGEPSRPSFEGLWYETRTALDRLATAATNYEITCPFGSVSADCVPLFSMHSMFQTASILGRIAHLQPDQELRGRISGVKALFRLLDKRWHVASVYQSILASQEAVMEFESPERQTSTFLLQAGRIPSHPIHP